MKRFTTGLAAAILATFLSACAMMAGMVMGSKAWFEKEKPDLTTKAASDLGCTDQPIEFTPIKPDEYREVEARGCSKKVRYEHVKVGPIESWRKASEPAPL